MKEKIGPEDHFYIETLSLEVLEGSKMKECDKVTSLVDDLSEFNVCVCVCVRACVCMCVYMYVVYVCVCLCV